LAGVGLLASYEAERRPVGLDVVESTSRALNTVLAHGEIKPAMRETQLLVGYRDSRIVTDACAELAAELPAPGDRVPEVGGLRQAFVGHAQRLQAHIGRGRHVFIGYIDEDVDGARVAAFSAAAEALRAALDTAAGAVLIAGVTKSFSDNEDFPILTDSAGEFATAFGARDGMIWVVRPDGHIGYRSAHCSLPEMTGWLTQALARG
jgi:hypothetical protein